MKKRMKLPVKVLAMVLVSILVTLFASAASTQTPYLRLGLSDPLEAEIVNANFVAIDAEFAARAVTPDMFKNPGDPDDTAAVQLAFDSGKPVLFNRDYFVKSVTISGSNQIINFNGYWLQGRAQTTEEAVLYITGSYLTLYNILVSGYDPGFAGGINTNYSSAVKWYSEPGAPSANNTIHNLIIFRVKTALVYGSDINDASPAVAAMTGNNIFGIHTRSVRYGINSNQPGGSLNIIGGVIDCGSYEWAGVSGFSHDEFGVNSYVFHNKNTYLTFNNLELLKTMYGSGYGFKGSNFNISNSCIEIGSCWGYIDGSASFDQIDGGFQGNANQNLFDIAPASKGRLMLEKFSTHRGTSATAACIIGGLGGSPEYCVLLEDSTFTGWSDAKITAPADRASVKVKSCNFIDMGASTIVDDTGVFPPPATGGGSEGQDFLDGLIDKTGATMPDGIMDLSPKSGWEFTFAHTGQSPAFGKNTTDTPAGFDSAIEFKANVGFSYFNSAIIPVTGSALTFEAWVKSTAGTGNEACVDVIFFDSSGAFMGRNLFVDSAGWGSFQFDEGAWKEISISFGVPAGVASYQFRVVPHAGSILITGVELYSGGTKPDSGGNGGASYIDSLNKDLEAPGSGVIFTAPDGKKYMMTVNNNGVLVTVLIDD